MYYLLHTDGVLLALASLYTSKAHVASSLQRQILMKLRKTCIADVFNLSG